MNIDSIDDLDITVVQPNQEGNSHVNQNLPSTSQPIGTPAPKAVIPMEIQTKKGKITKLNNNVIHDTQKVRLDQDGIKPYHWLELCYDKCWVTWVRWFPEH
ncbi:unnamed protein product [Rhizophagus irregularis]|nr:unnamed protein product [Rhizophagus irregularis]